MMTKAEIISGLQFTIDMFLLDPNTGKTLAEPRNDGDKTTIEACKGAIELLKQKPRKGHWIEERNAYGEIEHWHCSNCYDERGFATTCKWDFCPSCGADMRGV